MEHVPLVRQTISAHFQTIPQSPCQLNLCSIPAPHGLPISNSCTSCTTCRIWQSLLQLRHWLCQVIEAIGDLPPLPLLQTRHHRSGVLWRHFSCPDVIEGINYAHDEQRSQISLPSLSHRSGGHSIFVSTEIIFNSSNMELATVPREYLVPELPCLALLSAEINWT